MLFTFLFHWLYWLFFMLTQVKNLLSFSKTGQNPLGQQQQQPLSLSHSSVEKTMKKKEHWNSWWSQRVHRWGVVALSLSLSLWRQIKYTFLFFYIFAREEKTKLFWLLLAASRFLFFATARLPPQRRGVYLTRNSDHLRRIERKEVIFGGKPKKKKSGQCQAVQFFYLKKKKN